MKIYKETWEDNEGNRLDVAFTGFEMKTLPYVFRMEKRNELARANGFNIRQAGRIREEELNIKEAEE